MNYPSLAFALAITAADVPAPEPEERTPGPSALPPPDPYRCALSRETLDVVLTDPVCAWDGCGAPWTHVPVLLVRSLRTGPAGPARFDVPVGMCAAHRQARWEEYVTDGTWETICAEFARAGFPKPARHLTAVEHVAVPGRS